MTSASAGALTSASAGALTRGVTGALLRGSRSDPERAHELVIGGLALASDRRLALAAIRRATGTRSDGRTRTVFGLRFSNPVGLACGFDKNGVALPALAAMGFGFVEAGTVTAREQDGQVRPRIRRLRQHGAIVNWMGFPSHGVDAVARQQQRRRQPVGVPVGWNFSRGRATPVDQTVDDCLYCLRRLYRHGDYFAVNVSSPNTPGVRDIQRSSLLRDLVQAVVEEAATLGHAAGVGPKPVLVKIAPDLTSDELDEVVDVCRSGGVAGIIATNTMPAATLALGGASGSRGGVSGAVLAPFALRVVRHLVDRLEGRLPVVAVGGITTADDARRLLEAGADLLQLYTAFVYRGPQVVAEINAAVRDDWLAAVPASALAPEDGDVHGGRDTVVSAHHRGDGPASAGDGVHGGRDTVVPAQHRADGRGPDAEDPARHGSAGRP